MPSILSLVGTKGLKVQFWYEACRHCVSINEYLARIAVEIWFFREVSPRVATLTILISQFVPHRDMNFGIFNTKNDAKIHQYQY